MRRVVLATGNAGKLAEMRAILASRDLEVIPQSEFGITPPVEDGATFIANALIKARHAAAHSGLPAIADDSGLEVDALDLLQLHCPPYEIYYMPEVFGVLDDQDFDRRAHAIGRSGGG